MFYSNLGRGLSDLTFVLPNLTDLQLDIRHVTLLLDKQVFFINTGF